jgi:two-component system chemotaxis response regulator CheY
MSKILLVDDNVQLLEMLSIVLKGAGHDVTTAISGCDALWKTKDTVFNLVITDIDMPNMDGIEFITILRHRMPDLIIIATTGAQAYGLQLAKGLGVAQTLSKPVSRKQLLDAISIATATTSTVNSI